MSNTSKSTRPSQSEYSPTGEPEKATYPTNTKFRNILLLIGVILLAIGFIALMWLTFRPKTTATPPDGKVQQFEQKSQEEFMNTEDNEAQQP